MKRQDFDEFVASIHKANKTIHTLKKSIRLQKGEVVRVNFGKKDDMGEQSVKNSPSNNSKLLSAQRELDDKNFHVMTPEEQNEHIDKHLRPTPEEGDANYGIEALSVNTMLHPAFNESHLQRVMDHGMRHGDKEALFEVMHHYLSSPEQRNTIKPIIKDYL